MAQDADSFQSRLDRIRRAQRRGRKHAGFVVHADGVVTATRPHSDRLRFGFPLRGLVLSMVLVVAVKAYLVWALGLDVYTAELARLLAGSSFERAAGYILAVDTVTIWVSERYQQGLEIVQAALAGVGS